MPKKGKRPTTSVRRRAIFLEAKAIIDAEFRKQLQLDDVALRISTSRRQLQRAFSEGGETSFRAYLQRVRMDHAADLLREGTAPVAEIATEVGYRQPAQFAKAFRRHHGAAPSSFRATLSRPLAA